MQFQYENEIQFSVGGNLREKKCVIITVGIIKSENSIKTRVNVM